MKYDTILIMSFIMFSVALINFARSSNLFVMIVSLELMLNALNIALARTVIIYGGKDAIFWIITIISIAAVEVSLGLAVLIIMFKKTKTTDVSLLSSIKERFR